MHTVKYRKYYDKERVFVNFYFLFTTVAGFSEYKPIYFRGRGRCCSLLSSKSVGTVCYIYWLIHFKQLLLTLN